MLCLVSQAQSLQPSTLHTETCTVIGIINNGNTMKAFQSLQACLPLYASVIQVYRWSNKFVRFTQHAQHAHEEP